MDVVKAHAALLVCIALLSACARPPIPPLAPVDPALAARIAALHERAPFIDMHAHPDRFHRDNVPQLSQDEIASYRRGHFDLAVAAISTDAPFSGGYALTDGSQVPEGPRTPAAGTVTAFTRDRLARLEATVTAGAATLARNPTHMDTVRAAKQLALLPALEGADGLEGSLEVLRELHGRGLGLLQLVHARANGLGHSQNESSSDGLTAFGRDVIRECNRLGIVIDLAHANHATLLDALAASSKPLIVSHTGAAALHPLRFISWGDDPLKARLLTDDELRAIAKDGGVIGVWLYGGFTPTLAQWVTEIDHVVEIAGIDHVGIGTDLRGLPAYASDFAHAADFLQLPAALLRHGYSDEDAAKILGGNFMRVWRATLAD